jgi:predicted metal-dependent peptidase
MIQRIRSRRDVEDLELRGGGGTDMTVGIAEAQQLRPGPHILVVFTDGYTPWPTVAPSEFDSVIVVLNGGNSRTDVPGWARTIVLDPTTQLDD